MVLNDLERSLSRLSRLTLARSALKSAQEVLESDTQWRTEKIKEAIDCLVGLLSVQIEEQREEDRRNRPALAEALRVVRAHAAALADE